MDKQSEYIRLLQERNRLKKLMNKKSKREAEQEEKEKGFNTHFAGAHASTNSVKKSIAVNAVQPKQKAVQSKGAEAIGSLLAEKAVSGGKKGWGNNVSTTANIAGSNAVYHNRKSEADQWHDRAQQHGARDKDRRADGVVQSGMHVEGALRDAEEEEDNFEDEFQNLRAQSNVDYESDFEDEMGTAAAAAENPRVAHVMDSLEEEPSLKEHVATFNYARNDRNVDVKDASMLKKDVPVAPSTAAASMADSLNDTAAIDLKLAKKLSSLESKEKKLLYTLLADESALQRVLEASKASVITSGSAATVVASPVDRFADAILTKVEAESSFGDPRMETTKTTETSECPKDVAAASDTFGTSVEFDDAKVQPVVLQQQEQAEELHHAPMIVPQIDIGLIKIRIHSTWSTAKYVSLEGIRLRYIFVGSDEGETGCIELNPFLTIRVRSGFAWLAPNTDAVRMLPTLIGTSAFARNGRTATGGLRPGSSSSSSCYAPTSYSSSSSALSGAGQALTHWRGPISSMSALEVCIEGSLSRQELSEAVLGATGQLDFAAIGEEAERVLRAPEEHILSRCELVLSNISAEEASEINSSAAKDVDVYSGKRCVWSGELEEGIAGRVPRGLHVTDFAPGPHLLALKPFPSTDEKASLRLSSAGGVTSVNASTLPAKTTTTTTLPMESSSFSAADGRGDRTIASSSTSFSNATTVAMVIKPKLAAYSAVDHGAGAGAGDGVEWRQGERDREREGGRDRGSRGGRDEISLTASAARMLGSIISVANSKDAAERNSASQGTLDWLQRSPGKSSEQKSIVSRCQQRGDREGNVGSDILRLDSTPDVTQLTGDGADLFSSKPSSRGGGRSRRAAAASKTSEEERGTDLMAGSAITAISTNAGADARLASAAVVGERGEERKSSRRGRRSTVDVIDLAPVGATIDGVGTKTVMGPNEDSSCSGATPKKPKRASRRQQQQQQQPVASSSEDVKKEDAQLRKSIEAIRIAENSNRGRLGSEMKFSNRLNGNSGVSSIGDDSEDALSSALATVSYVPTAAAFSSMRRADVVTSGASNERAEKINRVNEKIQNSLAGLAQIMSTFPEKISTSRSSSRTFQEPILEGTDELSEPDASEHKQPLEEEESQKGKNGVYGDEKRVEDRQPRREDDVIALTASANFRYDLDKQAVLDSGSEAQTICSSEYQREYVAVSSHSSQLPRGKVLQLSVLSTWGDRNYVGMNGLELFNEQGKLLVLAETTAAAIAAASAVRNRRKGTELQASVELSSRQTPLVESISVIPHPAAGSSNDTGTAHAQRAREYEHEIVEDSGESGRIRADRNSISNNDHSNSNGDELLGDDPREVANLLDGNNFTRSDLHLWLSPIVRHEGEGEGSGTGGRKGEGNGKESERALAVVTVTFKDTVSLSMIRIFNYNKSRTHNQRGVRRCVLTIDGEVIFDGEIHKASGQLVSREQESTAIVFTQDSKILKRLRSYEEYQQLEIGGEEDDELERSMAQENNALPLTRPRTAASHASQHSTSGAVSISAASTISNQIGSVGPQQQQLQQPYGSSYSGNHPPTSYSSHTTGGDGGGGSGGGGGVYENDSLASSNDNYFEDSVNDGIPIGGGVGRGGGKETLSTYDELGNSQAISVNSSNNALNSSNSYLSLQSRKARLKEGFDVDVDVGLRPSAALLPPHASSGAYIGSSSSSGGGGIMSNNSRTAADRSLAAIPESASASASAINTPPVGSSPGTSGSLAVAGAVGGSVAADSADVFSKRCQRIRLDIQSTWGDHSYVGLSGIEILGKHLQVLPVDPSKIVAQPRDLSEVGCFDDERVPENLLNGVNDTADDRNMWLIPFTKGGKHFIEFDLGSLEDVAGIRVWNYNKADVSLETGGASGYGGNSILRGVKVALLTLIDSSTSSSSSASSYGLSSTSNSTSPSYRLVLRQGPGCDGVHFHQTILFQDLIVNYPADAAPSLRAGPAYMNPPVRQDYETPYAPSGTHLKFTFLDNWNDRYYIGLDRVELFDITGKMIDVQQTHTASHSFQHQSVCAQISAVPHSLRDLASSILQSNGGAAEAMVLAKDPRVPEQLFLHEQGGVQGSAQGGAQGGGDDSSGREDRCWLAPLAKCMTKDERQACVKRVRARMKVEMSQHQQQYGSISSRKNRGFGQDGAYSSGAGGGGGSTADSSLPACNVLMVAFQYPIQLGFIKLFNYSKTPSRGVRGFVIELDGQVIYMGSLQPANKEKLQDIAYRRGGDGVDPQPRSRGQAVFFTRDIKLLNANKELVNYSGSDEQDVLYINERKVMIRSKNMYNPEDGHNSALEGIYTDLNQRPMTSMQRS